MPEMKTLVISLRFEIECDTVSVKLWITAYDVLPADSDICFLSGSSLTETFTRPYYSLVCVCVCLFAIAIWKKAIT